MPKIDEAPQRPAVLDVKQIAKDLRWIARIGVYEYKLHNGDRVQSDDFNALDQQDQRRVRLILKDVRIRHRVSQQWYRMVWDTELLTFILLKDDDHH